MNAITSVAGIGHNNPPLNLGTALEPRALAAMIACELAPHTAGAETLLAEYQRFVVATAAGIPTDDVDAAAVDFAKEIKSELADLDATRAAIKAPVLAAQRAIDSAAKVIADRLLPAHTEVQRRHTAYLVAKDAAIRRLAAEAAARAEEAAWHLQQAALATRDVEVFAEAEHARVEQRAAEAVVFAPVLETTRMRTATGNTSGLKDHWVWEIEDASKIPSAFMTTNDKLIDAAIKTGTRKIPGLRIVNQPRAR